MYIFGIKRPFLRVRYHELFEKIDVKILLLMVKTNSVLYSMPN